jgi:UDP-glucuronate 4-epimerase
MREPILVTGVAGFIGFHLARRFLADGRHVVGIDNLNDYYDPLLKRARVKELKDQPRFHFQRCDIADRSAMAKLFAAQRFEFVVHMAAQAGVRYSLEHPHAYADSNLIGFLNVLEGCRRRGCEHLIYASSSSVYGANKRMPLRISDNTDRPMSFYGASKKANEVMAYSYASLFGIPVTGLRFFTVYGPWGRPDMAMWLFTAAILEGKPLKLFNDGRVRRDFTYIDDITEAVSRLLTRPPRSDSTGEAERDGGQAPALLYNVGNSHPVEVNELVRLIEEAVGRLAIREYLPLQPGDVLETCADCAEIERAVGFRPNTPLKEGIRLFVEWYEAFHAAHPRGVRAFDFSRAGGQLPKS